MEKQRKRMNLAQAIKNFVETVPQGNITEENSHECEEFQVGLRHIQDAIGQEYGDFASVFFSGSLKGKNPWFADWNRASSPIEKRLMVIKYIQAELNVMVASNFEENKAVFCAYFNEKNGIESA